MREMCQKAPKDNLSAPEPVSQDFRKAEYLASGRFYGTISHALG